MSIVKRCVAEFIGTFWLVFGGCGSAVFVLTFMFLMIILGSTDRRAPQGFAPIAIGLGLTLIHLIGIPVTNVSVNPARSFGPAILSVVQPYHRFGFSLSRRF